jgi:hypothetical protein
MFMQIQCRFKPGCVAQEKHGALGYMMYSCAEQPYAQVRCAARLAQLLHSIIRAQHHHAPLSSSMKSYSSVSNSVKQYPVCSSTHLTNTIDRLRNTKQAACFCSQIVTTNRLCSVFFDTVVGAHGSTMLILRHLCTPQPSITCTTTTTIYSSMRNNAEQGMCLQQHCAPSNNIAYILTYCADRAIT